MKLLCYLPTPGGVTGTPRRLLTLSGALNKHDIEVCIASDKNMELLAKAQELGFNTLEIPLLMVLKRRGKVLLHGNLLSRFYSILAILRQNFRFRRKVSLFEADAVWTRASKGIAFAGLGTVFSGRPLIWDVDYELQSRGGVRLIHRFGLWASHAVVFQYRAAPYSIFGQELANRYCYKFHSIIPGIELADLESFREMRMQRKKHVDDPFVILQVGTLCDRKNQMLLLEALRDIKCKDMHSRLRVLLVGGASDKEYVDKLEYFILENGLVSTVELLGWRSDVYSLMAESDILVMTSKEEGVPNAIQEAMYIGLPVLVSKAGGMPEVVCDGETGWVLPLDAPDQWARIIRGCFDNKDVCDNVSKAASTYALENFGTRNWGDQYSSVIQDAIASSKLVSAEASSIDGPAP